CQHSYETPYSF
nr:immunoglobulin light chain junction region [Macaca mulatta]MOW65557.1 immunoglobulin light chain junction region [Macaca mulatta]